MLGRNSVRPEFCSAVITLLGQSVRTGFCSARILLGRCHSARAECSDDILFCQNSARPLSLCSGRVFEQHSVLPEFCSAVVTLLGQSVRTTFYSDRILSGRCHSARAECSVDILFGQNSARPLSLCSGRVFRRDYVQAEFCSAVVTLLGQSVRTGFCSGRTLLGRCHSARAECSDGILFGQNSARPLSLCSGRVFGRDSVREEFCLAVVTLLGQSVRMEFCSDRVLGLCPRVPLAINAFEREILNFRTSIVLACDTKSLFISSFCLAFQVFVLCLEDMSESSVSVSSPEEDVVISSSSSLRSEPLRPSSSQPLQPSTSQPSLSLPAKNALGDVKDQAEDEANPTPWYTADEKSSKMSTEDLVELLREYPLPVGWYARLPGLQEPANYGTKYETGINEEQVRSGYRLPLHPFALRFFEHYHMAPGQLVPNGWRKLVGLIYLVQTLGYKPDTTDFMRVFFEIYFVKGVANCPGWYYIHSRQRLLKGGPKSNKCWHSRYFFVGRSDKGKLPFDREWNPYCKDFENPGKPAPNNLTKHILSHIKLRGGLFIDEPLSEQQLEWARMIPRMLVPAGAVTPPPAPTISSTFPAESASLEMASGSGKTPQGGFIGVLQKAKGKRKEKQPNAELPPALKKTSYPSQPLSADRGEDSQISEQHLVHGVLPRDKEIFQNQTHETFACSFAQAVYMMYASGSEMLSRFEMARQVAAEEAQQKRDAIKEAQEATHHAEELSIRDFLNGNAGDEWLKKRTEDGLEIYDLGFTKAKEMFAERFPDIPLEDFVLPAVASPSRETAMPSEAGDAAASHPPGKAECSAITLFGHNVLAKLITLFGQSVRPSLCSDIMF
ncbi:hypothetical protein RJ639_026695 [Escallonia herrerae]|uniref:Transposase (putative) gypsy type domain-containing protein n=1 Tax=Escallonia herrerae TaxID=1293975 RepID=A0AA88X4A5_9ASTE|nr:hypothetical protein RJ639_026695 [Escallonia herrerae]